MNIATIDVTSNLSLLLKNRLIRKLLVTWSNWRISIKFLNQKNLFCFYLFLYPKDKLFSNSMSDIRASQKPSWCTEFHFLWISLHKYMINVQMTYFHKYQSLNISSKIFSLHIFSLDSKIISSSILNINTVSIIKFIWQKFLLKILGNKRHETTIILGLK